MNSFDTKINELFPGLVVRKDLAKIVKGNAIVPSYVLEYLLGQYCATSDEASIQTGIETVKEILRNHFVHRNEAELVKSIVKEKRRHKVIDKISVTLNEKNDCYMASFSNLGIRNILVSSAIIKTNPRLLVSGVWCIIDLGYDFSEDSGQVPWILNSLKPIQISNFDLDSFLTARKEFTTKEWIDLIIQTLGFNPKILDYRSKLLQIVRLIPYCERNYNLIELGPKGTGKSHIYSEFSPHGILISGGEISVPKLFVNNSTGRIGLVGYWDTVAFDEFAGKQKKTDKSLVDIMKNYMANKSFSRGVEMLGAEASMVFVGNTQHPLPYMLKHADLFDDLPEKFHDSAFLDRIHYYIPGWEVDIIRGEMFSGGYGFVVDYLAEILRSFRNHDFSDLYQDFFDLNTDISTRDRDGINKTFSGLMKIIFPHGAAGHDEIEEILNFSIEGRKRVKDQLMRIDQTYAKVNFGYTVKHNRTNTPVTTLEEREYPEHYWSRKSDAETDTGDQEQPDFPDITEDKTIPTTAPQSSTPPETGGLPQLLSAARNLMDLLETTIEKGSADDHSELSNLCRTKLDNLSRFHHSLSQIIASGSGVDNTSSYPPTNPEPPECSGSKPVTTPSSLSYSALTESIDDNEKNQKERAKHDSADEGEKEMLRFIHDHQQLLLEHPEVLFNSNRRKLAVMLEHLG